MIREQPGGKPIRRKSGSDWIACRWLFSRSVLNPAIDFLPHLKPMSHSGGVKLQALENLEIFRRFLRGLTFGTAENDSSATAAERDAAPTLRYGEATGARKDNRPAPLTTVSAGERS